MILPTKIEGARYSGCRLRNPTPPIRTLEHPSPPAVCILLDTTNLVRGECGRLSSLERAVEFLPGDGGAC